MFRRDIFTVIILTSFAAGSYAAEHTVDQQDKSFRVNGQQVEKISVQSGDTVHFKNQDPFFHNVFSLSDILTFDLGSYPAGKSKAVKFENKGVVEVECAIHPHMFLEVEVK